MRSRRPSPTRRRTRRCSWEGTSWWAQRDSNARASVLLLPKAFAASADVELHSSSGSSRRTSRSSLTIGNPTFRRGSPRTASLPSKTTTSSSSRAVMTPVSKTMRRTGAWSQAHPFVSAFIDRPALAEVLPSILGALPLSMGDAYRGGFLFDRAVAPPLLPLPPPDDLAFFSVMYPQILKDQLPAALDAHRRVADLLTQAGGQRYAADWLDDMDSDAWTERLGDRFETWSSGRKKFDPNRIFRSALLPTRH